MAVDCPLPMGEVDGVKVYAEPTSLGTILLEVMPGERGARGVVGYLTIEGEPLIVSAWMDRDRIVGLCLQSGGESARGDGAARLLESMIARRATGLVELRKTSGEPPSGVRLSKPLGRDKLVPKEEPAGKERIEAIESMNGIGLGILMSEIILSSRLIAKSRNLRGLFERGLRESRRRRELVRVAFFRRDGSVFNVFLYGGRVVRLIILKPGGIEAELVRDKNMLEEILEDGKDVTDASLYVVDCPRCTRIILGDKGKPEDKGK